MGLVATYFDAVRKVYESDQAREHAYRPALWTLFDALREDISVINEPRRSEVGAPDFLFYDNNGVPVACCEAKDVTIDLANLKGPLADQFERYANAYHNLLYTNALDFHFYRDGELVRIISIGEELMGLQPIPDAFDELETQLRDFVGERPRTIHHSRRLAEFMAAKAAIIKDVMGRALVKDLGGEGSELTAQYHAFKEHLIHDITAEDFADIYAETIAYGMFAARLHDPTPETFSREEALGLLPKSNPFLRSLFGYIAGQELDDRIAWIIDDLAKIFLATNLGEIMADFGSLTGQNDPFLHFYETFLSAYNPKKRKARGVWYTPEPVVNFIVRAVDEVLQTEFGLPDGLADTSKIIVEVETGQTAMTTKKKMRKDGKSSTVQQEVHRVQILDPATGTGTFLAEVIKLVAGRVKGVAPGAWSQYIEKELIPRLHGFELLMASYAMCHMKIDMILSELGYRPSGAPPRLSVWLTNSLEEGEPADQTLPFARWLSNETKGANEVKRDKPIMCVIGNPPYAGHSSNKGEWIESLMADYKVSPELKRPAQAKWLSDDYVKFIRMAEFMIEKNGEGVLGFITNHGYLDNPTFMDMRRHLLDTFDKIHVLDLHGNTTKKEVAPDGSPDKNVFDIKQGVAIIIGIKKSSPPHSKTELFHGDLWGARSSKYDWLARERLCQSETTRLTIEGSPWPFVKRDLAVQDAYDRGFGIAELMALNGRPAPGFATQHDEFAVSFNRAEAVDKVETLLSTETEHEAREHFRLCSQNQWQYARAKSELKDGQWRNWIIPFSYRPLDTRFTVYNRNVAVHRRIRVTSHLVRKQNVAFLLSGASGKIGSPFFDAAWVTDKASELNFFRRGGAYLFPLYLYPEENSLDQTRRVNFEPKIWKKIHEAATHPDKGEPDEVDIFDYIYGVLHSPEYRETFKEFLKIDFPRVPYPATSDVFWHVAKKGAELRHLHLMENAAIGETPYPFEGEGDNVVDKPVFKDTKGGMGRVCINGDQAFADVPTIAWEFYIGGYQPAQKWLKDRRGRELSFVDLKHYQKIIKILSETGRIVKEIELPIEVEGELQDA
jgi:hypothetical protein